MVFEKADPKLVGKCLEAIVRRDGPCELRRFEVERKKEPGFLVVDQDPTTGNVLLYIHNPEEDNGSSRG